MSDQAIHMYESERVRNPECEIDCSIHFYLLIMIDLPLSLSLSLFLSESFAAIRLDVGHRAK